MRNTTLAPLTISFEDGGFKNLEPEVRLPHVQSCAAGDNCLLFRAWLIEDFGGWHYPHNVRVKKGYFNVDHDDDFVYRLPYQLGSRYKVAQGYNGEFSHKGEFALDWTMPEKTPILAARGGEVIEVVDHYSVGGVYESLRDRGNNIKILHNDNSVGAYVHLARHGARVKVGDEVIQGQEIGLSGSTGYSSGPHLHFEVYGINSQLEEVTFPVKFEVGASAPVQLQEGKYYRAVSVKNPEPEAP